MVYIIKSTNGERTAHLPNQKKSSLLDEIKESLEGLVFKIEIKIASVSKEEPVKQQPAAIKPMPIDEQAKKATNVVIQEPVKKPAVSNGELSRKSILPTNNEVPTRKPAPVAVPTKNVTEEPLNKSYHLTIIEEPIVKTENSREVLKPQPQVKLASECNKENEPIETKINDASSETPIRKKLGRPMKSPKINKGSLSLGKVIERCLIALDTKIVPPVAFIAYEDSKLLKTVEGISSTCEEIEAQPCMTSAAIGDIVFGKSADDGQWYRAIIESAEAKEVKVFFFDWGLYETLPLTQIRHILSPDLGLSSIPACAVKVNIVGDQKLIDDVFKMEEHFKFSVDSYDDATETYKLSVIGRKFE